MWKIDCSYWTSSYSIFCFIIVSSATPCIIYHTLCKLISTERIINFLSDFSTSIEFLFPHKHAEALPTPLHTTQLFPFRDSKRDYKKVSALAPCSPFEAPRDFQGPQEPASVPHTGNTAALVSAAAVTSKALLDVTSRASAQGPHT